MTDIWSIILTRALRIGSGHPDAGAEATLEIGVPHAAPGGDPEESRAGFRITPLTDWRAIHGVDAIQAVQLAIQIGEQLAESLGAVWPDEAPGS